MNIGDKVVYVPRHANGDLMHKDCEEGIIERQNDKLIFVRFGENRVEGCYPRDLIVKETVSEIVNSPKA